MLYPIHYNLPWKLTGGKEEDQEKKDETGRAERKKVIKGH